MKISDQKIRDIIKSEILKSKNIEEQRVNRVRVEDNESIGGRIDRVRGGRSRTRSSRSIGQLQSVISRAARESDSNANPVQITGEFDDQTKVALWNLIDTNYRPTSEMPTKEQIIGSSGGGTVSQINDSAVTAEWSREVPYAGVALGYEDTARDPFGALAAFINNDFGPNPVNRPDMYINWQEEQNGYVISFEAEASSAAGRCLAKPIDGANPADGPWEIITAERINARNGARAGTKMGVATLDASATSAFSVSNYYTSGQLNTLSRASNEEFQGATAQVLDPQDTTQTALPPLLPNDSPDRENMVVPAVPAKLSIQMEGSSQPVAWVTAGADNFARAIPGMSYSGAWGSALTNSAVLQSLRRDAATSLHDTITSISSAITELQPQAERVDSLLNGYVSESDMTEVAQILTAVILQSNEGLDDAKIFNGIYSNESWSWGEILQKTALWGGGLVAVIATGGTVAGIAGAAALLGIDRGIELNENDLPDGIPTDVFLNSEESKVWGRIGSEELGNDMLGTSWPNSVRGRVLSRTFGTIFRGIAKGSITSRAQVIDYIERSLTRDLGGIEIITPANLATVSENTRGQIKRKVLRSIVRKAMNEGLGSDDFIGSGETSSGGRPVMGRADTRGRGTDEDLPQRTTTSSAMNPGGQQTSDIVRIQAIMGMPETGEWNNDTQRRWASFVSRQLDLIGVDEMQKQAIANNWAGTNPDMDAGSRVAQLIFTGQYYRGHGGGAYAFLNDLMRRSGSSPGSPTISTTEVGGKRATISSYQSGDGENNPAVAQRVAEIVASQSIGAGDDTVTIIRRNTGRLSIKSTGNTIPRRPQPNSAAVRSAIRDLDIPRGTTIVINLQDPET